MQMISERDDQYIFFSQHSRKHLCKSGNLRVTKIRREMKTQTTAVIPKLFIGMDVHKKSWTVHFKTDLFDNKTVTMPAEPSSLISYVQKNFEDHEVSCCYEAGCCGYWIARELLQKGWEVKVVNPADVPRNNKQDWQKTDKIDSRNLCKHLSDDNLKGIYIPDEQQEQLRSLFRRRIHLARNLRSIKNHIKSQLLYFGIKLPEQYDNPNWSREMKNWIAKYKMEIQQCRRKYEKPFETTGIYVV